MNSTITALDSGPTSNLNKSWYEARLTCGHKRVERRHVGNPPSWKVGDSVACTACTHVSRSIAWLRQLPATTLYSKAAGLIYLFAPVPHVAKLSFLGAIGASPEIDPVLLELHFAPSAGREHL